MAYLRQIPLCVNVSSSKLVDPLDGAELLSHLPALYCGEQAILCISFVDSSMNPVVLGAADIFECSLDSDYVHSANGVDDQLMMFAGPSAADIAGDWSAINRADGKISIRVNCQTTGFASKIGEKEKLAAWLEIKCVSGGAASVMCQSQVIARNAVHAGEGSPGDALPAFNRYVADLAYLKTASNLADLASVATARTNLGLGGAATLNVGTASGTVAAGNHAHSGAYEPANSNIQAHLSNVANPHSVTKTQIGLANVSNVDATNASNISSGTLAEARLPASVPLRLTTHTTVNIPLGSTSAQINALISEQPKNLNGYQLTFQFASPATNLFSGVATIAGNGTTATATQPAHGYATGDIVYIDGTTSFDGGYAVTVLDAGSYTFSHSYNGTETPASTAISRRAYILDNRLDFGGFYGGSLKLYGNTSETGAASSHKTQHVILHFIHSSQQQSMRFISCLAEVTVQNLRLHNAAASSSHSVFQTTAFKATINYCAFSCASSGSGMASCYLAGSASMYACMVSGGNYGVYATGQHIISISYVSSWATLPTYGVAYDAAIALASGTQPTGSTANTVKLNAGQLFN